MTDEIREKIYDISLVIKEIGIFPQTYNTILGELCNNGTCNAILRRKLGKLCKSGEIFKTNIPGTRFGKVIFYCHPKDYYILVEAGRLGSNAYYFYKHEKVSRYYIKVKDLWLLKGGAWVKQKEKIFFEGNILKFI